MVNQSTQTPIHKEQDFAIPFQARPRDRRLSWHNPLILAHKKPGGVLAQNSTDTDSATEQQLLFGGKGTWTVVQQYANNTLPWNIKVGDTAVPFVFEALVGAGSYGKVYRVAHRDKTVAIKVISHSGDAIERTVRGATLMMSLNHKNIATVNGYICWERQDASSGQACTSLWEEDATHQTWIVEEFCYGGNLHQLVKTWPFRNHEAVDEILNTVTSLLADIAAAVACMHKAKVVHGDLKCSNILIKDYHQPDYSVQSVQPKIVDFGLSRTLTDASFVHTGTIGTLSHMSPEVLRSGQVGYAADTYAFGMIMYELLTGLRPYRGMLEATIIEKVTVAYETPHIPGAVPKAFVDLMRRCWSYKPDQRPTFVQIVPILRELHHSYAASSSLQPHAIL